MNSPDIIESLRQGFFYPNSADGLSRLAARLSDTQEVSKLIDSGHIRETLFLLENMSLAQEERILTYHVMAMIADALMQKQRKENLTGFIDKEKGRKRLIAFVEGRGESTQIVALTSPRIMGYMMGKNYCDVCAIRTLEIILGKEHPDGLIGGMTPKGFLTVFAAPRVRTSMAKANAGGAIWAYLRCQDPDGLKEVISTVIGAKRFQELKKEVSPRLNGKRRSGAVEVARNDKI